MFNVFCSFQNFHPEKNSLKNALYARLINMCTKFQFDIFINGYNYATIMTLRKKSVSRAITCLFWFYPSYNGYRARPE